MDRMNKHSRRKGGRVDGINKISDQKKEEGIK